MLNLRNKCSIGQKVRKGLMMKKKIEGKVLVLLSKSYKLKILEVELNQEVIRRKGKKLCSIKYPKYN